MQLINFRPFKDGDMNFVLNSWLESHRDSNEAYYISNPLYFEKFQNIIRNIIADSDIEVVVNPENYNQIYGYICHKRIDDINIVHYAYVKYTWRKLGIFRRMMAKFNNDAVVATFAPRDFDELRKKFPATYNPFLR